jgi:cytochrome oxidase Cu insertion factor (SCO1/SenC/PrrC family)
MGDLNGPRLKIKKIAILLFVIGIVAAFSPLPSGAVSNDFLSDAGFLEFKEKKSAPDFQLKDSEDNPTRSDAFQGKIVLLYFWTTW